MVLVVAGLFGGERRRPSLTFPDERQILQLINNISSIFINTQAYHHHRGACCDH